MPKKTVEKFECPNCGPSTTTSTDSRAATLLGHLCCRRRVKCRSCLQRFTTYEIQKDVLDNYIDSKNTLIERIKSSISNEFNI